MAPLLGGGLEPRFRVLFSAIFHSIAQGNCHQRGKQWKVVEAKLLQTAASLRTCFVLVIHPRAPKPLVPFLGILSSGCQNIELSFRSWPKRNQYLANSFPGPAPFRGNSNQQVLSPLISWKRFRGSSNAVHRDVATLQIKCPKLFKFRISAGKRKSHIDEPERVPPSSKSLHFPYVGSGPI